jgi:hypothetical protein
MRRFSPLFVAAVVLVAGCKSSGDSGDSDSASANAAPTCAFTAPETNASGQQGALVTFSGTVADAETAADALTLTLSSHLDGDLGALSADADGLFSLDTDALTVGTHSVILNVDDGDGNTCEASTLYTVGNPPSVEIVTPETGDVVGTWGALELEAVVGDDVDPAQDLLISWSHADLGEFDTSAAAPNGTALAELEGLSVGVNLVTLTVTDSDGFYAEASVEFDVNGSPTAPDVAITPASPGSTDTLTASVVTPSTDPEGDAVTYTYAWYVDGAETTETSETVDASLVSRNEAWSVVVTPWDGNSAGEAGQASVVIGNAPPSVASVSISPTSPVAADAVTCSYSGFFDEDGDADASTYAWQLDGVNVGTGSAFPGGHAGGDTITCIVTPNDGVQDGSPVSASVVVGNTAPVLADVTLSPSTAYESSTLTCTPGSATDVDGDSVSYTYTWTVDGSDPGETTSTLTGTFFDSGDAVTCSATPTDGTDAGSAVTSNSVTISNTAPAATTVSLTPSTAYEGSTLTCTGTGSDDDGDSVSFTYTWTVDGTDPGVTASTLTGTYFDKGQAVVCAGTPSDGADTGTPLSSSPVTISNTAPTVTSVGISPAMATEADTLTCAAVGADDDGDSLTTTYAWTVNGTSVATGSTLTGTYFDRGDAVVCVATVSDGSATATSSTASLTISNAPPTMSSVSLSPSTAYEGTTVTCTASASDLDGDTITFSTGWTVNGSSVASTATTLTGSDFDAGDSVVCVVTPNDGTEDGAALSSSALTITNSTPTVSSISISPDPAYEASTLTCAVTAADADGDTLSTAYAWTVNGSAVGTAVTLTGSDFDRGDSVVCTATVSDGSASASATSSTLTVSNTAPTAPTASLSPSGPYASDTLTCTASGSSDADGDSVTYSYVWTVDGTTDSTTASTVSSASTTAGEVWQCFVTASDGTDSSSQSSSSAVTILSTTTTYDITYSMLNNQGRTCSSTSYDAVYNNCSGDWGFTWTDTGSGTASAVTVEMYHGIVCGTPGTKSTTLNGVSAGSFTLSGGNCNCNPSNSVQTWALTNVSGYSTGASNTFVVPYGTSCEGLSINTGWGSGVYARVTVEY